MIKQVLNGWDVEITKTWVQGPPGDNGEPEALPGWTMTFEEKIPRTGNKVEFTFGEGVKDYLVRELSGGIVLPPGSKPIDQFRAADDGA